MHRKKINAAKEPSEAHVLRQITHIGFGSHTFEIPKVTAEETQQIARSKAGDHECCEKHSDYEVQSVNR